MSIRATKFTITVIAVVTAIVHLVRPGLAIDGITATLLIVAVLPWLSSLFKSIELPGGLKVEYRDLEKIEERARKSGLLAEKPEVSGSGYAFQAVATSDPNLALAGLRIELEKRLVRLAQSRDVVVPRTGLNQLLRLLNERELIGGTERALLSDLTTLLNSAVHGATVESSAVQWALEIGPQILEALDKRTESRDIRYEGITQPSHVTSETPNDPDRK